MLREETIPQRIRVKKKIWLAETAGGKIIGWTTEKPQNDNGDILPGTILTFRNMYRGALNYEMIQEGIPGSPEFLSEEVEKFLTDGTFEEVL